MEQRKLYFEDLKNVTEVIKVVGPRGGFRYLCYKYTNSDGVQVHASTAFRKEADELTNFFERNGIIETID